MSIQEPAPEYKQPVAPAGLGYVPEGYLPPPAPRSRRRTLVALIVVSALVLAGGAVAGGMFLYGRLTDRATAGDVAVTARLSAADGAKPAEDAIVETRRIIEERIEAADIDRGTVTVISGDTLVVTAAPEHRDQLRKLLTPGNLTFRLVLGSTAAAAAPAAAPGSGGCQPDPAGAPAPDEALAAAKAKLGATYTRAEALREPTDDGAAGITGFAALTCAELAALPARMLYAVGEVGCPMLDGRAPGSVDGVGEVTACDPATGEKLLLDAPELVGVDLAGAEAAMDPPSGEWIIEVTFTEPGATRWAALTERAARTGEEENVPGRLAILMDTEVLSAPAISGAITGGKAQITGNFTRDEAMSLATRLASAAIPLRLEITGIDTVR